jgi:hypothetical protein
MIRTSTISAPVRALCVSAARLALCQNAIAVGRTALTAAHIRQAIHRDEAVETHADAAEDTSRLATTGRTPQVEATRSENYSRDALPERSGDRLFIDDDRDG